jgi:ferritin
MVSKKVEKALNEQLNYELQSAYHYAAMAAYFDDLNLEGFSNWMKIQVREEVAHSVKFYNFIDDRGGRIIMDAISKPPAHFDSPLAAFEAVLEHERSVTKRIYKLVDLAREESDHATETFLGWFVTEQVEEEANADAVVKKLKLVGKDPQGLFWIDRELSGRQAEAGGADTGA